MALILTACLAFAASALMTRAAIPWLRRQGAVATENHRTMHQGVIPKGGGLPLLLSALFAASALTPIAGLDTKVVAGLAILAALSWRDDIAPLPAAVRLPVHVAVAALAVLTLPAGARVFQGLLPGWLDAALAILALTWMMNLYNFMDGINGLAGVETVAIAAGYLLIGTTGAQALNHEPLAASVLGASAGFLLWNLREKALVFLGDVGSVPLGFLMGVLMIDLAVKGFWAAALILPAYVLADATLTLIMRAARGESFWEPHKTHFYQRAAHRFHSHTAVVRLIGFANVLLVFWAADSARSEPWWGLMAAALIVALLLFTFDRAGAARSPDSGP